MRHLILGVLLLLPVAARAADDVVLGDFEGDNYGTWQATGTAFGDGPARGTLPGQMPVSGFAGKGLANSFRGGDGGTGTLTSPEFAINRPYLTFLIGGGGHPGLEFNLLVDGKAVRTATGPNTQPGGSENLASNYWDVTELAGKTARLQIVDNATGGWGHINVDEIRLSDRKPPRMLQNVSRPLVAEKRFLNLPVKNGAEKRRIKLLDGADMVREFNIELAEGTPDFWVFLDLTPFKGRALTLQVDRLSEDSKALDAVVQSDEFIGAENIYQEKLRPQWHFSSRRGWLNDPNGLVFYKGEYHLFYQHNPYGWKWDNMHWGHAVSRDLVHWEELPAALYQHGVGDMAFSGSAVVDAKNTSGFKTGGDDVLIAAYTSTGRGECIVFSNDRGRTWKEYEDNPVIKHQGRDPRLLWHEALQQWVMALYDERNEGGKNMQAIAFYTSPDLKKWTYQSRIDGFFECPDLFELPVDGSAANRKWVLLAADGNYMVGAFDGKTFLPEGGKARGNWGNCFYAAQTFSNVPPQDGRRVQIGWGRVDLPGMPFNQMMLFPCELSLHQTPEGVRMAYQPAREIEKIYARKHEIKMQALAPGDNPLRQISGELFDIRAELEPGDASQIGFTVRGVPVVYDVKKRELSCEKNVMPLAPKDGKISLRILADRASLEIFSGDGLGYMPLRVHFADDNKALELFARDGSARVVHCEVSELRSIWPAK